MEPITIADIQKATGGELVAGEAGRTISRISTDTRTLERDDLFIALRGRNFDGHDYLLDALGRGCAGIIYDRGMSATEAARWAGSGMAFLRVGDTLGGLHDLAGWYRSRFTMPLVAVTGSNGKTTTKEMIRCIATGTFSVLASEGTLNNHVGVPMTLLRLAREHTLAVLEIGMNARGEIGRLARIASPTIGLVTNVGPAHIEFLGSVENVAASKAELLETMAAQGGGVAVLNRDDPRVARMAGGMPLEVRTFGMGDGADVRGESAAMERGGVRITMRFARAGRAVTTLLPVAGLHNAHNALAAAAACETLGIAPEQIARRLREFRLPPMRMELLWMGGVQFVNDAYNANPASMRAAIEALEGMPVPGKRILVAGEMLELGAAAGEAHRGIGMFAAEHGVDLLIAVGGHAAEVIEGARGRGMRAAATIACRGTADAAAALRERAREGDCVLLKASRRVGLENVLESWGGGN